ncbi:MAG: hypothetical protein ABIP75_09365 [Pyrinomonadaceae bacterium]
MHKTIAHQALLLIQYGVIAFIATAYAFNVWLGPVEVCNGCNEVWMMLDALWKGFFRWWLLAFLGLSVIRLAVLAPLGVIGSSIRDPEKPGGMKREFQVGLQFGLFSLLAAGFAFRIWIRAVHSSIIKEVPDAVPPAGFGPMLECVWTRYFRWWLLIYLGLSLARIGLVYLFRRFRYRTSLTESAQFS